MTPWDLQELGPEWDAEWDALASQTPESGLMQSSAWAAFKRAEGYETRRYGFWEGEHLHGGATFYTYSAGRESGFVVCPEGPVLPWGDTARARVCLRALIAVAERLGEPHGALGLRIEPHLPPPAPSLLRNWSRAPVDLTPTHTLVVDVTQPDDALLRALRPKARYNLALSQRHGVQVICSTDMRDWPRFYALFVETAQRNGFFAEPYGFFLNLGAALFPSGQAALLLTEWQGQVLAAHVVVFYGRRATYLYGGSMTRHKNVMPSHALYWAGMQEARARGCLEYDLFGYDPFGQPDHLYAGISRFKAQWGAARRDSLGARDLVFYDRLADRMIDRWQAQGNP